MLDSLFVFPPQWSPFQPALSLPSLAAWQRRAGYDVDCLDLNLEFFYWLFSEDCAATLASRIDSRDDWSEAVRHAYRSILASREAFRADLTRLRDLRGCADTTDYTSVVQRNYIAVRSAETYLAAVSDIAEEFRLSPYAFDLDGGNLSAATLEDKVRHAPASLRHFLTTAIAEQILPRRPRSIGISCIGQDQLYFSLLLGSLIKEAYDAPILIGGTILSRIYDRGVLDAKWFGRYFDVIVRNEGERPCETMLGNLQAGRILTANTPGVVYLDGERIRATTPAAPLRPEEIPFPDFDDLPLGRYFAAETTLPLVSSRGCYWGKCEFCHHGVVYGDKYSSYEVQRVLDTVTWLSERYKVRQFAFNDEAIPPKLVRSMGRCFPQSSESGWTFTGLIKFENYFQEDDFRNLAAIGFRSLYVGLESASERVLRLMKKNNTQATMVANLQHATRHAIWMHCFLFFGFPGETESDARETYDFVLQHSDIIGSFGTATFALEHNAPIYHHLSDFGVATRQQATASIDVYYDYDVSDGVSPKRAKWWMNRLNRDSLAIRKYQAGGWIPREHLLYLLSLMPPSALTDICLSIHDFRGLPPDAALPEIATLLAVPGDPGARLVINRVNQKVLMTAGSAAQLLELFGENSISLAAISDILPPLGRCLAYEPARGSEKDESETAAGSAGADLRSGTLLSAVREQGFSST